MNWQKTQTKTGRHVPLEQIDLTLSKCKEGYDLCLCTHTDMPDKSVAFLLYRLCKCYEEITNLLKGKQRTQPKEDTHSLQWQPEQLDHADSQGKQFIERSSTLANEKIGELLFFQQELLYQLRITIALLQDRQMAFELSGSVARFQILHDYLAQSHSRFL